LSPPLLSGRRHRQSDPDVRPFLGSVSDYPKHKLNDQVSVGPWIYKVTRMAPIESIKHVRHSEFGPFGDPQVMVLGIEIIVRNMDSVPNRLPPITLVTGGTTNGAPTTFEVSQFSGYIERRLDSAVVFDAGEQLRGVVAFECCVFSGLKPGSYLHVSGGGKSALISLDSQPLPPSAPAPCSDPAVLSKPPLPDLGDSPSEHQQWSGLVSASGRVSDVRFVATLEYPIPSDWHNRYARAARENLAQWNVTPAMCNGQPIQMRMNFDFYFNYSKGNEVVMTPTSPYSQGSTARPSGVPKR